MSPFDQVLVSLVGPFNLGYLRHVFTQGTEMLKGSGNISISLNPPSDQSQLYPRCDLDVELRDQVACRPVVKGVTRSPVVADDCIIRQCHGYWYSIEIIKGDGL